VRWDGRLWDRYLSWDGRLWDRYYEIDLPSLSLIDIIKW